MKRAILLSLMLLAAGLSTVITECGEITSPGYYELGADILNYSGTCITISSDNVTLDCKNHLIDGTGNDTGIVIKGNNTVVRNCVIREFYAGIEVLGNPGILKFNIAITNNVISNVDTVGVHVYKLSDSSNITITNNTISNIDYYGINVFESANVSVINNVVKNICPTGIVVSGSYNIIVADNIVSDISSHEGILVKSSSNTIVTNNTILNVSAGKGMTISDSSNITVIDNTIMDSGYKGLYIDRSSHITITNNTIFNISDEYGLNIEKSSHITITNNTISVNGNYGIWIERDSSDITVMHNTISALYGILVWDSSNITITNNTISSGKLVGIGIMYDSTSISITNNDVSSCYLGVFFFEISGNGDSIVRDNRFNRISEGCGPDSFASYFGYSGSVGIFLYQVDNLGIISDNIYSEEFDALYFLNNTNRTVFMNERAENAEIILDPSNNNTFDSIVAKSINISGDYNVIRNSQFTFIDVYGDNNTIQNTIVNPSDVGIYLHGYSNRLIGNTVCGASVADIIAENDSIGNSTYGENNTCNTTVRFNDFGALGCSHLCVPAAGILSGVSAYSSAPELDTAWLVILLLLAGLVTAYIKKSSPR